MSDKTLKVAVGVPNKGITDALCYDNHLEFMHKLGQLQERSKSWEVGFQFYLITIARVFPALARERIAEFAINDHDCDYLFMYDEDMILPLDLFDRLYKRNVDIIAPLAFTRLGPPHQPVIYNLEQGWDPVENKEFYVNHVVYNYPKDSFFQCDAVGFGAVLIKGAVLKAMKQPWFMTTSGAGEDIHFCHKAGKAGFKVFADTTIKLGHLGVTPIVTEETYEAWPATAKLREIYPDEVKYPKTA